MLGDWNTERDRVPWIRLSRGAPAMLIWLQETFEYVIMLPPVARSPPAEVDMLQFAEKTLLCFAKALSNVI